MQGREKWILRLSVSESDSSRSVSGLRIDPAALKDRRMENLVAYARKVEGDMYESANNRVSVCFFLLKAKVDLFWLFSLFLLVAHTRNTIL